MKPSLRLRFWLHAMDFANWTGWRPFYLFTVGRASDATDWGDEQLGDPNAEAPF